jgi:hypothetical protein
VLGHHALRVVDVTEHDGVGRAYLLARGLDVAIGDSAILFLGFDLRRVDALHAVGALLHDAAASHGDVRIAQPFRLSVVKSE